MICGVIFDCFGVLYEGSLEYLASLAPPENQTAVFDVNHSADYGYISHQEYVTSMAELIHMQPNEIDTIARQRFIRNDGLVDFVHSLRPRYKTALLSNVGHSVIETLFTPRDVSQLFDIVVLSGEVGMTKPYPEIYELTAARLKLSPEQCVMVDDLTQNVEGAEMTGMKGLVYGSVRQFKVDFERLIKTEELDA